MSVRLTIVVLTLNEARNIAACLRSLATQSCLEFDVVLVDAASTDGTLAEVGRLRPALPFALSVLADPHRLPIGEARNLGVRLSRAPAVAFLSADAELDPAWVGRALAALAGADMAFGRQVHAPTAWSVGAAVRGLRYHFPEDADVDPLPLASNVAAAYRRDLLLAHPFDAWSNAAEDLLLARRAAQGGRRGVYDPAMVVRHHDVADAKQELRKTVREGQGCALYRRELGLQWPVLAWGLLLAAAMAAAATLHGWWFLGPIVAAYAPALRRALRPHLGMPLRWRLLGLLASPFFDLAFLAWYLGGLARRPPRESLPPEPAEPKETPA